MLYSLYRSLAFAVVLIAALPLTGSGAVPRSHDYVVKIYQVNFYPPKSLPYPLVSVYFRAFDRNREPLANLAENNIRLIVDGKLYDPEKHQYFVQPLRQRPQPLRTVLIFDAKKSMCGKAFEASLMAAARFIDLKRPQDQIAILAVRDTYGGYDPVYQGYESALKSDPAAIGCALADIKCDGIGIKSRIYDALWEATRGQTYDRTGATMHTGSMVPQEMSASENENYPATAIVIFSDGLDVGSSITIEELNASISTIENPIPIYAVGVTTGSTEYFKGLESLSDTSYGKFYPVGQSFSEIPRVTEKIADTWFDHYVVTFRPFVPEDGQQHAFTLGIEYPSARGKYACSRSQFEARRPKAQPHNDETTTFNQRIPALTDDNPYMRAPAALDCSP